MDEPRWTATIRLAGGMLLAVVLAACGDDGGGGAAGTEAPTAAPASSGGAGDGSDAASGEVLLEVDGRSFVAEIETCNLNEQTFVFSATMQDGGASLEIGGNGGRAGRNDWTAQVTVLRDGSPLYNSGTNVQGQDSATMSIDGPTLSWHGPFSKVNDEGGFDVIGDGTLSARCD